MVRAHSGWLPTVLTFLAAPLFAEAPEDSPEKADAAPAAPAAGPAAADIAGTDSNGETALHVAVKKKNRTLAALLLEKGADPNLKFSSGSLPLHMAATAKDREMAELLLRHGAEVNAKDAQDETALYRAVKDAATGKNEIAELLLEKKADPNAKSSNGKTMLHHAVQSGNRELVEQFLNHGADINATDSDGATPLADAAKSIRTGSYASANRSPTSKAADRLDMVRLLLDRGADRNAKINGSALLPWAVERDDVELVHLLLDSGCPGPSASIVELENFLRWNAADQRAPEARDRVLAKAAAGEPWDQINRHLACLEDIEGASYDAERDELVIFGPEWVEGRPARLPPLLIDDYVTALKVFAEGKHPGVSIGTFGGTGGSNEDHKKMIETKTTPVEYIPSSTTDTHMGAVFFEVDRLLKTLAHGEDNLTGRKVRCPIEGYRPVCDLLTSPPQGEFEPLGRWWFLPEETVVAREDYTMKFVRYRMKLEYKAERDDPSVAAFGDHFNKHFDDFHKEYVPVRELVRLHKLVQVARWYYESGFPTESFLQSYRPIAVKTPQTTRMLVTPNPSQTVAICGGINLSPGNRYVAAGTLPAGSLVLGSVSPTLPQGVALPAAAAAPPRYRPSPAAAPAVPAFARPILQARPAGAGFGWTARVEGKSFVAVAVPAIPKKP